MLRRLNEKIKTLATKQKNKKLAANAESKAEQDEIVKLQTYVLSCFTGQSFFVNDGAQFTSYFNHFFML